MFKKINLFAVLIVLCIYSFSAKDVRAEDVAATIGRHVPQAAVTGSGEYRYFLMSIYQATLYAPDGDWSGESPFALVLHYHRNLKGERIAKASVDQIRKQGYTDEVRLAAWYNQMAGIFPDVAEGDEIVGILKQNGETVFYHAGQQIGHVRDHEFGQRFFDIWLGHQTTAPHLRRQLLAGSGE